MELELHFCRTLNVACEVSVAHFYHSLGHNVGNNGDNALTAEGHEGNYLVVVTGVEVESVANESHCFNNFFEVAVCFLDTNDIFVVCESRVCCGLDVYARTRRYVVKDDGLIACVGNVVVELDKTLLACFVVVGSNNEERVCANLAGFASKLKAVCGIVASCTCDDGDSAANLFNSVCDSADVILVVECGGFARCAANNKGMYASLYLVLDKSAELRVIYAVFIKGSDEGCGNACEYCFLFHGFVPLTLGEIPFFVKFMSE